jgi:hypothetical protein
MKILRFSREYDFGWDTTTEFGIFKQFKLLELITMSSCDPGIKPNFHFCVSFLAHSFFSIRLAAYHAEIELNILTPTGPQDLDEAFL